MDEFVKIIKGGKPWQAAYKAIAAVFTDDVRNRRVLLKPSVGFEGPARSGLSTHPEVIRGLIRFFKDRKAAEVVVGDSSVIGVNSVNALKSAGISALCDEEGVPCIDLNSSSPVEKKIKHPSVVDSILFSAVIFEMDYVISVPVMKTHMYTGASLSIKNMKGAMYKREKNKLHRIKKILPPNATARALDYGIMDLTTVCFPDYAVVDGIVGMEGFGPSGGTPKAFGCIVASKSPLAADLISMRLMGLTPDEVGHIRLIAEREGITDDDITVEPPDYRKLISPFTSPAHAKLALNCDALEFIDESACSGCHAALTQFMRYHSDKFAGSRKIYLFAGRDIDRAEILKRGDRAFLVGNCTHKFRRLAPSCKGCPPVDSEIMKMVSGLSGVTITCLEDAGFRLSTADYSILIGPFLKGFPPAPAGKEGTRATHVCVTHTLPDYIGEPLKIPGVNGTEIYIAGEFSAQLNPGANMLALDTGSEIKTEFGWIKVTRVVPSSAVAGGLACGYLMEVEGVRICHMGDLSLAKNPGKPEPRDIDVALLPVDCSIKTTLRDALKAIRHIHPRHVIPIHTGKTQPFQQDIKGLKEMIEGVAGTTLHLLKPGQAARFKACREIHPAPETAGTGYEQQRHDPPLTAEKKNTGHCNGNVDSCLAGS